MEICTFIGIAFQSLLEVGGERQKGREREKGREKKRQDMDMMKG